MKIIQSRNWWIEKDLKWILDNADFMFLEEHENRPYIVTKEKLPSSVNSDCFKMDNDMYGILLNSHSEYHNSRAINIVKKTYYVKEHFQSWMKQWCSEEHFNPSEFSVMLSNIFRKTKKKDIIIEV